MSTPIPSLDKLKEALDTLEQQYHSTYRTPEAIYALMKTIKTFNITITDWNTLIDYINVVGLTLDALYAVIPELAAAIRINEGVPYEYATRDVSLGEHGIFAAGYGITDYDGTVITGDNNYISFNVNNREFKIGLDSEDDTSLIIIDSKNEYSYRLPTEGGTLGLDGKYVPKVVEENSVYVSYHKQQTTIPFTQDIIGHAIVRRTTNGYIKSSIPINPEHTANKKYVDTLVETVRKNAFIDVDILVYSDLNSFLESDGEEGYIYLYPINTQDLTKGYRQYIWENQSWRFIGNTIIDLSNYVDLTSNYQLITGIKTISTQLDVNKNGTDPITWTILENDYNGLEIRRANSVILSFGASNFASYSHNPFTTNTYDLGGGSQKWKDLYLSGTAYIINFDNDNGTFIFNGNVRPKSTGNRSLGNSTYKWKDLYLHGSLYGATFDETIDDIYTTINNTIGISVGNEIKWSRVIDFIKSADTTFTFETAKINCLNEYKAFITNGGSSSIILTFTGVNNILCNDDNCVVSGNTLTLPSGTTIEINCMNNNLVAINWSAQ